MDCVTIIGGGLAGSEAAWQIARAGIRVRLFEMRPLKGTGAHRTDLLGELVCSNSLKSNDPLTASGILKMELEMAGSLVMEAARASSVSAGSALAVDRELFARYITSKISSHPLIEVIREEVKEIPAGLSIIATGPLTSPELSESIRAVAGKKHIFFYDAIAPIIEAESIDLSKAFRASRYGKGGDDYLNCPMTEDEYKRFYHALLEADVVEARPFEEERMFEGCLPIEVMARRGMDTLRFGPMRPVGLGQEIGRDGCYAVVQLRPENRQGSAYNMVGFQTRLKIPEQKRVFRLIPGLERAEFLRYGSIHRNTFIHSPSVLNHDLTLRAKPETYIAGQLVGVEGYIESTAMGILAGINIVRRIKGSPFLLPPRESAHGALLSHITAREKRDFQPTNINFALFPPLDTWIKTRAERRRLIGERARSAWEGFVKTISPL